MDDRTRRLNWAATLPKRTWAEWNEPPADQETLVTRELPIKDRPVEHDQIITGKAPPLVPPAEDFSAWTRDALVREIWNEASTAFIGGVLGIPIASVGLLMIGVSSVEWRPDSPAGIVAGGFIVLIGCVIVWLFQRRWSGLKGELQRRNAAEQRGQRAGQRRVG